MAQTAAVAPLLPKVTKELIGCWPVERGLAVGSPPRLCGQTSMDLQDQANDGEIYEFLRMLEGSPHFENLVDLVRYMKGVDEGFLSQDYSKGIVHLRHLLKYERSNATVAQMTRQTRAAREEHLIRNAQIFLYSGNLRRHCELLVQAGRWERALAMAPGVSLVYWRQLADKYAQKLSKRVPSSGSNFSIACGRVERAITDLHLSGQGKEAMCVAQALTEGCYKEADDGAFMDGTPSDGVSVEENDFGIEIAAKVSQEDAEKLLMNGYPFKAACCHLAIDDVEGAISKLLRANELVAAAWLSKTFRKSGFLDYSLMCLLRRCDKMVAKQFAVSLVQNCKPDLREFALICFCARQDGSSSEIDALHHTAGFPSMQQCLEKAELLQKQDPGNVDEIIKFLLLSSEPENALQIGINEIYKRMSRENWKAANIIHLLWSLAHVRQSRIQRKDTRMFLMQLNLICAYVGASMATVQRYHSIVPHLLQAAICSSNNIPEKHVSLTAKNIKEDLRVFTKRIIERKLMSEPEKNRWKHFFRQGQCDGLIFPGGLEKGESFVSGSSLPAHSDVNVSLFTSKRIRGPVFFLSDGRTALSLNEALMWAKVNPLSPNEYGLMNPF